MAAILLTPIIKIGKTVAYQYPMFGKGEPTLFWAEQGLVRYEDRRPTTPLNKRCGTLRWETFAKRALGISAMVPKSWEDKRWKAERRRVQKFIGEAEAVIQEAKQQGSPFDDQKSCRAPRMPIRAENRKMRYADCDF